jgi:hypothetical protein
MFFDGVGSEGTAGSPFNFLDKGRVSKQRL